MGLQGKVIISEPDELLQLFRQAFKEELALLVIPAPVSTPDNQPLKEYITISEWCKERGISKATGHKILTSNSAQVKRYRFPNSRKVFLKSTELTQLLETKRINTAQKKGATMAAKHITAPDKTLFQQDKYTKIAAYLQTIQLHTFSETGLKNVAARHGLTVDQVKQAIADFEKGVVRNG